MCCVSPFKRSCCNGKIVYRIAWCSNEFIGNLRSWTPCVPEPFVARSLCWSLSTRRPAFHKPSATSHRYHSAAGTRTATPRRTQMSTWTSWWEKSSYHWKVRLNLRCFRNFPWRQGSVATEQFPVWVGRAAGTVENHRSSASGPSVSFPSSEYRMGGK